MSIQEQQQPNRYVKLPPQQPHDHFLADVEAEAREFPLFVSVHLDGEEARQMWEEAVLEARTCTDCGGPIEDSAPRCPSCAAIVPYYTLSCGNVFADLGLPDAEDLLAAADRGAAQVQLTALRVEADVPPCRGLPPPQGPIRRSARPVRKVTLPEGREDGASPQVVPPPAWAVPATRRGEILPEALPPWYDRDPPGMPDPVDDFIEQEGAAEALRGVALGTVCPRCAVRLPLASDQLHVCSVPQEDAPGGAAGGDER